MTKTSDADDSRSRRFKIGYVAFHLYDAIYEINETVELIRQHPDARIYSFYRKGSGVQTERVREIGGDIVTWSCGSILRAFAFFCLRCPLRLGRVAVALAWASKSNPVFWIKNGIVFAIALPILADALKHRVTHLHADFGSAPATIAWLGRRLLGTGFSIKYHSFDIYHDELRWKDPLRRRKLLDADLVVAVHDDGLRHLRNKVPGLAGDKFKMIRISVVFHPLPKPERLPEPPLVLAAGNLVPAKGFDVLVRAAGVLKERNVPIRLRILGEGGERERLTRLVRANGIEDRVEMPGYYQHAELARHLADAMVLVCPARVTRSGVREGLPTVIPEAWLSRTPVIATPIGGIPEVVEDGKTGLLFPAENATALAECIARLIASSDLRRSLAEGGHDRAVEEFSPEKNVRELLGEMEAHSCPARGV